MNRNPGSSVNLDGGGSSLVGVVDAEGKELLEKRQDSTRGASTLIAFSEPEAAGSSNFPVVKEPEVAAPDESMWQGFARNWGLLPRGR
jgi:hypothetical protein